MSTPRDMTLRELLDDWRRKQDGLLRVAALIEAGKPDEALSEARSASSWPPIDSPEDRS